MGAHVDTGRFTAASDRTSITVFLIGMRANRWWKVGHVWRTVSRMPPMLRHLMTHPDSGLLGFHNWFGRTTLLLSYWESPEHLQRFAADHDAPHLAAWREFIRTTQGTGDVGIWHETYQAPFKDLEVVYNDMPLFGLAAATTRVPVSDGSRTARQRLGR